MAASEGPYYGSPESGPGLKRRDRIPREIQVLFSYVLSRLLSSEGCYALVCFSFPCTFLFVQACVESRLGFIEDIRSSKRAHHLQLEDV